MVNLKKKKKTTVFLEPIREQRSPGNQVSRIIKNGKTLQEELIYINCILYLTYYDRKREFYKAGKKKSVQFEWILKDCVWATAVVCKCSKNTGTLQEILNFQGKHSDKYLLAQNNINYQLEMVQFHHYIPLHCKAVFWWFLW